MLAVVEIAGIQFEVEKNQMLNVPLLPGNPGELVEFGNILAKVTDKKTTFGTPYLEGKVEAKIVEHGKGDKILIFHKKRRKGHRKLNGHRQRYTTVEIMSIK